MPSIEFNSPLGPVGWLTLAGIPAGIVALYFLKLRRKPVRVPSTLLWKRSLEDLHVNSLFQRLRRNLLLALQLITAGLAMLALAGPRIGGSASLGKRVILLIDNSASMSATDVAPSRLARAKEEASKAVRRMGDGDLAMVVAFSDTARIVSNYTGDQRSLLARIDGIEPSQSSTSLREALQVAAGLANPSKQIGEGVVASSVVTPKLLIYTDGGFADVEGFSVGNLEPEVMVIGSDPPPYKPTGEQKAAPKNAPSDNVAIVTLQSGRNEEKPEIYQLFGRVHNYRGEPVTTEAQLLRHDPDKPGQEGKLADAVALEIPPQSDQSFKFDVPDEGLAEFEVRLTVKDALQVDNHAFALVGNARKARVVVVTAGNRYLLDTLQTPTAAERADISVVTPEVAKASPLADDIRDGRYDLIIYDGVRPEQSPEANTLYFGAFPPGPAYANPKDVQQPVILDWDVAHPLMQYIRDLSLVFIAKAKVVDLPPGATRLIDSNLGPLAFSVPRDGFTDSVVTFPLLDGTTPNTTWFRYISFPLFILNGMQTMGNVREASGDQVAAPGRPQTLRAETPGGEIQVTSADGKTTERVSRTSQGTFVYNAAATTGLYHARWDPRGLLPFAVNLFDQRESDIATRGLVPAGTPEALAESYRIKIGYNPIAGLAQSRPVHREWWKPLALLSLGVLLVEWYIYNRRIYI